MRNMARFLLRRLLFVCFLIIGVTFLVFMISHLVPSDPIASNMSPNAMSDPAAVAAYKARWGLDKPLMEQYFIYLSNLLRGDLGTSIRTGNPVISDLKLVFPCDFRTIHHGDADRCSIRDHIWDHLCSLSQQAV